jgi:hypothetical protein
MAQVNIHLSDELKAALVEAELPLGELARGAWERELRRSQEAEEMEELRIDAVTDGGGDVELRFTGEILTGGVYHTDDDRAVLVDEDGNYTVWTRGNIDENEDGFLDAVWKTMRSWGNDRDEEEMAEVLRDFNVKPVIRL